MANQFSVQPLGGLDVGSKLTQVIEGGKQQYRIKQMQEKAPEVFNSGDPTKIAQFMLKYPEMAPTMGKAIGVQDELQNKEAADVAKSMLTPGADPKEALAQWATKLKDQGRDPSRPISMLTKLMQDPTQSDAMAQKLLAITSPQDYLAYQKTSGSTAQNLQKTGAWLVKNEDGTVSVVTGVFDKNTGGLTTASSKIPGGKLVSALGETGDEQSNRKVMETAGQEAAKLGVQLKISPEIAGAIATEKTIAEIKTKTALEPSLNTAIDTAKNAAKTIAKASADKKSNAIAWDVYNTGITTLQESLKNTVTGPLTGFIPAITESQQIADGAIALMAPLLKNVFRKAGEGTFTKDDQEILMAMLPTRRDKPAARIAKIKAVNSVVRATLGQPPDTGEPITGQANETTAEQLTPEQLRIQELEKIAYGSK